MKRLVLTFLAVLAALTVLGPSAASAHAAQSAVVLNPGGHAIQFSGSWSQNPELSTTGQGFSIGFFENPVGISFGVVVYDPALLPARELITEFVGGFSESLTSYTVVDAGAYQNVTYELGVGDDLTLFALFLDDGLGAQSVGYFVVAPSQTFADAVTTIQNDFTLDGGRVLTGVDGVGLQNQALGQSQSQSTTVNPSGPTTFVPLDPAQATQTVTAGSTNIDVFGAWQYDMANSIPEQATFTQFDIANQTVKLVSYGEFFDNTVADPAQAMNAFTQAFFQGAGATNTVEVGTGFLADGSLWRMYTLSIDGTSVAFLVTVGQRADGAYVVSSLLANIPVMAQSIVQVQNEFLLNGSGRIFEDVIVSDVTFNLPQGGGIGGETAAGQTVTVGTTQLTVGGPWVYDSESSTSDQASFNIIDQASRTLRIASYGEFLDFSVTSLPQALDVFSDAFFQGAGVTVGEMAGSGQLADGTMWRMYTFPLEGNQIAWLITASQRADGTYVISTLAANSGLMQQTIVQVQNDFRLNGTTPVFNGINAAEVTMGLPLSDVESLAA